ncbi:MAG: decarboxylase [Nanoarchaeota archaeon]|jgi:ornithine decarboxylase|nr:decarboxylase [Nanoarchaeota archaeon]
MKPKFILSKKVVLEQYEKAESLVDIVSYSSKTNPIVTGILEDNTSSMFSIHSVHELKNIKDKSRIMFLSQGWENEEISYLIGEGVRFFVVDNVQDLETLKKYLNENKVEGITLFLRLKLKENTLRTEKHFVFGFGSDFVNDEILELKDVHGVVGVGVHFHRKTQNMAEWDLKREIENVLDRKTLEGIDYLVMGGGLPSVYANTNVKVFEGIYNKIRSFRDWLNGYGVKVINEPGRFISAPAVKLETNIKAIYEGNIIVDASVYNSDLDAVIVPVKLLVEGELEKGEGEVYAVKGITPCSMDLFRYRVYLKEPKVGDKLVFLNAGAYNFTTNFCDLPMIETLIVD